jgi:hypothetical protein
MSIPPTVFGTGSLPFVTGALSDAMSRDFI